MSNLLFAVANIRYHRITYLDSSFIQTRSDIVFHR